MDLSSIEEAIQIAQERWASLDFTVKTHEEACSFCPWCGGTDRFLLFISGYYLCRAGDGHCGKQGWLDENEVKIWTPKEKRLRRIEAEQARAKHEREKITTQLQAIKRMAQCKDHLRYHENLTDNEAAFDWFLKNGLELYTVYDYKIGYCKRCPTDRQGRPSYTFPIWRKDGVLWSIRHRIVDAESDKYRPHMRRLGLQLVNAQELEKYEQTVIVEGAKKCRVVSQYGIPAVGILGKSGFESRWLQWFPSGPIYIALDPDATENADKLGKRLANLNRDVRVAHFPMKPDDLFIAGGTEADFWHYLRLAKGVH